MIIVVDAYNLLRAIPPYKKSITEQERKRFIAQLSSYGRRKGHKMVIVFDGGSHEWPFKESMRTVQIVYSGMHESADDCIKEYIESHRSKDLLLVSSDGELNRYAARMNIPSIDVTAFYELMHQELLVKSPAGSAKHNQLIKTAEDTAQDLDEIMMNASKNVPIKSEDFVADKGRVKKNNASDKNERALLKKLNKL
jgi:predicted RNA-binding protein with PIN domain